MESQNGQDVIVVDANQGGSHEGETVESEAEFIQVVSGF